MYTQRYTSLLFVKSFHEVADVTVLVSLRNLNLSMESSAAIPDAYSSIKRAAGIAAPKSSRARITKERFVKQMR